MKKILPVFLMILTCGAAHALPVGNPAEASLFTTGILWGGSDCCDPCDPCFSWCDAWSLRMGFYGDYVFNRHLENKGNDATIRKTEIYTNAGYLALNFCDRVDVFTSLGASNLELSGDSISMYFPGDGILDPDLDYSEVVAMYTPTFSWSIGARATLWECNCLSVGLEGQYFRFRPKIDAIRDDSEVTPQASGVSKSKYSEWQVGLGVAYNFETQCPSIAAVPYIAVKWAGAKMKNDGVIFDTNDFGQIANISDYESSKSWGYAVGSSFTLCHMLGVTVEGRFGDEKALYVNGQIRF